MGTSSEVIVMTGSPRAGVIVDRNADVWEPMMAVAQQVGGLWHERAATAASWFVANQSEANNNTVGVELLRDIRTIFGQNDRISTNDLLAWLWADDTMMWDAERLTDRVIAKKLKPFESRPARSVSIMECLEATTGPTSRTPGRGTCEGLDERNSSTPCFAQ